MIYFFVTHNLLHFSSHMDTPNMELFSATAISTGQLESPILPLINVFIQEAEYAVLSTLQHPLHNNLPKKLSPKPNLWSHSILKIYLFFLSCLLI